MILSTRREARETSIELEPARLTVSGLVASYSGRTVVDGVSFDVGAGEFVTLLGPSGCGKTTTLRCVAGLHPVVGGAISLGGETLSSAREHQRPEQRPINMVFQSYAIWPHMTVEQNVAYGLHQRGTDKAGRDAWVRELLDLVGLTDFATRGAAGLSGGQQQRVALARALATKPRVLLLDEPLSNLDAVLRGRMRAEIMRIHRETGTSTLYVTHDRREALSMSDRIVVMRDGVVEQVGTPQQLYDRPVSRFVAEFLGYANIVRATVVDVGPTSIDVTAHELGDDAALTIACRPDDRRPRAGAEVGVVIRPESAQAARGSRTNVITGQLATSEFFGNRLELLLRCGALELKVEADRDLAATDGGEVTVHLPADSLTWVPLT